MSTVSTSSPALVVEITPNSPAAEALAANSSVRVSKLHKAARSTRIQASIRLLKSTLRTFGGQPGHAGDRRGSPDFCPPSSVATAKTRTAATTTAAHPPTILEDAPVESSGEESSSEPASPRSRHWQVSPVTHPALPSAVAAACRAGEELERLRMTPVQGDTNSDGPMNQSLPESISRALLELEPPFVDEALLSSSSPDRIPTNEEVQLSPVEFTPPISLDPTQGETKKKSRRVRKQFSIKSPMDEDIHLFHFHGPRSVRNWIHKRRHRDILDENIRSYVKGKVIDRQHELFIMSIAIMLGMRTSIGRTNMQMAETSHDERRWLDNDDLMAVEKYVFPPQGSAITPPHQLNHTFKFKDYSPHAFAYLRRMFGVNEYEFLLSVCGNANYIEFQSNAKSGQFFFYSKDGKYMIKTMTSAESKFLRRITPHYFRHCVLNPNTLVTKFLGMYRVKLYHLRRNVKFVVMKSVYDTDKHLHHVFDVKGSSAGRDAKAGEAVKKDNDVRRALPEGAFVFESNLRDRLRVQVERDCQWLKAMKIMDYSMLIGVHNITHNSNKRTNATTPSKLKAAAISDFEGGSSIKLISPGIFSDEGDEFSHASHDASSAALDPFLVEDDDDSYLEGSSRQLNKSSLVHEVPPSDDACASNRVVRSTDVLYDRNHKKGSKEHVEKAIEDMYWPFHRYYDIHGRRRLIPISADLIAAENKSRNVDGSSLHQPSIKKQYFKLFSSSSAPSSFGDTPYYQIPIFERPLSERKDGGFIMDLTNFETPLRLSIPGAPHIVEFCDGKIFYMGIIDILQQFNIRKRLEARWRRMGGKGWEAASCVHPTMYADRFLRFFDEYTSSPTCNDKSSN